MKSFRIALVAIVAMTLMPWSQATAQVRRSANQIGRIVDQIQKDQRQDSRDRRSRQPSRVQPSRRVSPPSRTPPSRTPPSRTPAVRTPARRTPAVRTPARRVPVVDRKTGRNVYVVKNSRGSILGRYFHDVIHIGASFILPHHGTHQDSYHRHNGLYYYTPRTALHTTVASQPVVVQYGSFAHVDDLASRLREQTNELLLDLHYNYPHNVGFSKTYAEGYRLLQAAKSIQYADPVLDRRLIQSQITGMDALLYHLQHDLQGWSRHQRRQVSEYDLAYQVEMIDATLHHLMNDAGVAYVTVPSGSEVAPPLSPGFIDPPLSVAPAPIR